MAREGGQEGPGHGREGFGCFELHRTGVRGGPSPGPPPGPSPLVPRGEGRIRSRSKVRRTSLPRAVCGGGPERGAACHPAPPSSKRSNTCRVRRSSRLRGGGCPGMSVSITRGHKACPHGARHIKSSSLQTYRSGRRAPVGPAGTGAPRCAEAGAFARLIRTSSRFRIPQPVLHSRPDFQQNETPIRRNPYRTNVLRQPRGTSRSRGTSASGPRSPTPARRPRAAARPR
jgi:hypothetical protein